MELHDCNITCRNTRKPARPKATCAGGTARDASGEGASRVVRAETSRDKVTLPKRELYVTGDLRVRTRPRKGGGADPES